MKDSLAFDSVEDSFLFENERTCKRIKNQPTKCLEPFIEIDYFCFNKAKTAKTNVILDFFLCSWYQNTHEKAEYHK